jgi:hypothetical protein
MRNFRVILAIGTFLSAGSSCAADTAYTFKIVASTGQTIGGQMVRTLRSPWIYDLPVLLTALRSGSRARQQ